MKNLHPVSIAASSLPIYDRAVARFPQLKPIQDAFHFCQQLCHLAAVSTITVREYDAIARVASGDLWPRCLVLECIQRGRRFCRIMSARDIALVMQPGVGSDLVDAWHVYQVDAGGRAVELQAELDAPRGLIRFWSADGALVDSGKYAAD